MGVINIAYDVTALVTAISEGTVDENEARALISEFAELEIKVAKLLNPKAPEEEYKSSLVQDLENSESQAQMNEEVAQAAEDAEAEAPVEEAVPEGTVDSETPEQ
jgi:hypothetical protein